MIDRKVTDALGPPPVTGGGRSDHRSQARSEAVLGDASPGRSAAVTTRLAARDEAGEGGRARNAPQAALASPAMAEAVRRVAAYVRVSSASQDARMQRSAIKMAAQARGDVVGHWYAEKVPGAGAPRPELERLRADARRGALGRVYVYRLDRLSRGGIRQTLEIVQELRGAGVELVLVADAFDLTGPAAEPMIAMLAWCAEWERAAIRARMKDARERVERAGGTWGRAPRMDPKLIAEAQRMHATGASVRRISMALKVPKSIVGRAVGVPKTPPLPSTRPRLRKTGSRVQ